MIRAMFALFFLAIILGFAGCAKKPAAKNASDYAGVNSPTRDGRDTEVATGDLRELLLTLTRVHFPYDSATLVPETRKALESAAEQLVAHPEVALYVDGHTDERGTTEYNMSLGERRAQTVVDFLKRGGVEKVQLSVISHGEEEPLAAGSDAVAYAENRRVEFRLIRGNVRLMLEEGTLVDDQGRPIPKR